jgi:hypothetical protein
MKMKTIEVNIGVNGKIEALQGNHDGDDNGPAVWKHFGI